MALRTSKIIEQIVLAAWQAMLWPPGSTSPPAYHLRLVLGLAYTDAFAVQTHI
jgi:hypothetical protein